MTKMRTMGAVVAVLALAAGAVGCGDGSSASDGGKIKIMTIGQFQASSFSLPEMEDAAKAAVEAINKDGGINGTRVEILTCNDQGDPNVAGQCARKAVSEKVDAVTGSIELYSQSVIPILEAAEIAYIGAMPLTDEDFTSPVSFPLDGGNPANFAGEGVALVRSGCKNVGIVVDSDSSAGQVSGGLLADGVEFAGGKVAKQIGVKLAQPDMAPAVSTLIGAGAECIGIALPPAEGAKFLAAIRQSSHPDMAVATNVATAPMQLIKAGKGMWEGVYLTTSAYVAGSEEAAGVAADLKAYDPSVEVTAPAVISWSAVQAFAQIAEKVDGEMSSSAVLDQAKKTTDLKVATFPEPFDFTKPNSVADYARMFNTKTLIYQVKDDQYDLTTSTPVDVQGALE